MERDEARYIVAIVPMCVYVALPTVESGRPEDCPWCALGDGTVDDCHCGMRVCEMCAEQPEEGACTCGHQLGKL